MEGASSSRWLRGGFQCVPLPPFAIMGWYARYVPTHYDIIILIEKGLPIIANCGVWKVDHNIEGAPKWHVGLCPLECVV